MAPGTGMPPQWIKYWVTGAGGEVIKWGVAGDFDRCVTAIEGKVTEHGKAPLSPNVIHGLCATLHKMATGATPGHAATEQGMHK
jgi:hypothetical protein